MKYKVTNKSTFNSKIIIIEDSATERSLLKHNFSNEGFVNIYESENGADGFNLTKEIKPDLIILDINMPKSDGYEYLRKIKSDEKLSNIPVLVQTGLDSSEEKLKIFEHGASDYINKPLDFNEVTARTILHLERAIYFKEINIYNERVKQELETAKSLIDVSLPSKASINHALVYSNLEIASKFESTNDIGGDFWGFHQISKEKVAIYLIDVSGHGIYSSLNALRIHSLISASKNIMNKPAKMLNWLNGKLVDMLPAGHFATMLYGVINTKKQVFKYSTAASSPFIIFKRNNQPSIFTGKGFPLGISKDAEYEKKSIRLKKNDILCMLSDGLYEAEDKTGKVIGFDNTVKIIQNCIENSSKNSLNNIVNLFENKFCESIDNQKIEDDLTINLYRYS